MKRLLVISFLAYIFIGCGSSSVSSGDVENSNIKTDNTISTIPSDKKYRLYDYLCPSSSITVKRYKYKNRVFQSEESLEYISGPSLTTQRSLNNLAGQVEYQRAGDTVSISIYHDNETETFSLNNFLNVGDTITLKQSQCTLSNFIDELDYEGHIFRDVLEITCPKSIGYYQKDRGLVVENIIDESLQTNSFLPADYPDRKIGGIDVFTPKYSRFSNFNVDSAIAAQVDKLWADPYNLNGSGMKIGIVDGGSVRSTHVDLRNRVTNLSNAELDNHATHVAGTMISAGGHLPAARGFANEAEVYSYSYSEIFFAKSVKKLVSDYGVLISNHSYGYEGPEGIGEYDRNSRDLDLAIRENPYIIAVMAAGNDGDKYKHDSDYRKWGLIKGGSNSKNVITVGALDDDLDNIASFSSVGPIDGGRLKPDIVMDGTNVLSTIAGNDNDSYARMEGTSMATPAATGTITLLSQRYAQVNGGNVRLDTMKAILFNTAKDVENTGPDYKSGFGHVDALKAVKVIDSMKSVNDSLVKLDKIYQGDKQRFFINSESYRDFKVTLAWVDDSYTNCNNCANDILVNDIDMVLINENTGEKIYPYTLDASSPDSNAVQTKNNMKDPQEQIHFALRPGNYTLELSGRKISSAGQDFTLVTSQVLSDAQKEIFLTPMNEHIHKIYIAIQ